MISTECVIQCFRLTGTRAARRAADASFSYQLSRFFF